MLTKKGQLVTIYKLRQAGDRKTQHGKRKTDQEPDGDAEK